MSEHKQNILPVWSPNIAGGAAAGALSTSSSPAGAGRGALGRVSGIGKASTW
jgi:hypothetical protein